MLIKPFAALCPAADKAAALASVPYDVCDTAEARALAAGNPDSFLHVSRPEIDLPDETDIHADCVYAQGVAALKDFQTRGTLIRDTKEHVYVYRQIMGKHSQTGVVVCCSIDDYANNIIRKHEKTRKDKEDDRTRHCLELNANTGPVFLTYRDEATIDTMVARSQKEKPLYDFTAADGIRHTVWRATGESVAWQKAFAAVPLAYVADGHHRAAAAYRAGMWHREHNPNHTGTEEYNWFLAVLFPANQLQILPYNRCVADLNGLDAETFLAKVSETFHVRSAKHAVPAGPREVRMFLNGCWYSVAWDAFDADPVSGLDVSVLQDRLLAPILGIVDPRTDTRISFIGGIRGTDELEARVADGRAAVAFSLFPVTVDQMIAIADAGQIMPPKSTWFEPKLRSGLLVHTLDAVASVAEETKPATPLEQAQAAAAEMKDRYARLLADFDNFRKRQVREREDTIKRANEKLLGGLLPVVDHLELALAKAAQTDDPFVVGVKMVLEQFLSVLAEYGATPIDAVGEPFDPAFHEALTQMPSAEVAEGIVIEQFRRGWLLGGKLLRAAQVVVSSGAPDKEGK